MFSSNAQSRINHACWCLVFVRGENNSNGKEKKAVWVQTGYDRAEYVGEAKRRSLIRCPLVDPNDCLETVLGMLQPSPLVMPLVAVLDRARHFQPADWGSGHEAVRIPQAERSLAGKTPCPA